jgi:hypothetical protein
MEMSLAGRWLPVSALLLPALLPGSDANAFWNTKAPADWTIEEVREILQRSPWAAISPTPRGAALRMHIASAEPMRAAETRERQATRYRVEPGPNFEEYQAMLNEGHSIVLAVYVPNLLAISDAEESRSLEHDSVMHVGRRSYKLVTNFPPTPGDPYLRYVFPREVKPGDKSLSFDIYVPGYTYPERHVEFDLREMTYKGQPAY